MRILYPHYFGQFFNRTNFIVSPQTNYESYTLYRVGLGPDESEETQKSFTKEDWRQWFQKLIQLLNNATRAPHSSYHTAPNPEPVVLHLHACWLMTARWLLPSGHRVFIQGRKGGIRGNCHPCPTPFIRKAKFSRKWLQQTSSYILLNRMKSHDELLCFWFLRRFGQVRDVSKDWRVRVERGQGILSPFLHLSLFCTAVLATATSSHNYSSCWSRSSMAPALSGLWQQCLTSCLFSHGVLTVCHCSWCLGALLIPLALPTSL